MNKWICKKIWDFSEWSGIGLGKYAPIIFGTMIGSKPVEVDHNGKRL